MKKIKMRRYSFSSNKSQLIVCRITTLSREPPLILQTG